MRPSPLLALALVASLAFLIAAGLSGTSGCRGQDLCLVTFKALCACDDPDVKSCTASYEVLTCVEDAGVDPCASAPCCPAHRDAAAPDAAGETTGDAGDAKSPADAAPEDQLSGD